MHCISSETKPVVKPLRNYCAKVIIVVKYLLSPKEILSFISTGFSGRAEAVACFILLDCIL